MSRSSTRRPEKSRTDPPKPAAARPQPQRVAPPGALQRALSDPATASPDQIRTMQHSLGNRAVSRLLTGGARGKPGARKPVIQPKLTVGPASDSYEQEADRVAADVMRRPAPAAPGAVLPGEETDRGITPPVQREAEAPEQMIQAQPAGPQVGLEGGEAGPEVESRLGASRGAGNPLPDGIRSFR